MTPRAHAALALYALRTVEALEEREHFQTLEFERLWGAVVVHFPDEEAAARALEAEYPVTAAQRCRCAACARYRGAPR